MAGTKLFVGGIPAANATPESLTELFEAQGASLLEVVVLPPKGTSHQTRCGFVRVQDEVASYICEALNGMAFEGHAAPLVVRLADNGGGKGASKVALPAPRAWPSSPAVHEPEAVPTAGPSGGLKDQALAEGRFVEAAEYRDQEFAAHGETREAKLRRLHRELHVAAVQEHFYEAAAVYDKMNQLDPQAAAASVTTAIAAAQAANDAPGEAPKTLAPAAAVAFANGAAPVASDVGTTDYLGHIITFNQERRYGFISCPELGADAFLSDQQLGDFEQGACVVFNVRYNPQGKPQAQNLRAPDDVPSAKRARAS